VDFQSPKKTTEELGRSVKRKKKRESVEKVSSQGMVTG